MKIKVKQTTETETEMEITFPYYRLQQNAFWYKLINENEGICIEHLKGLNSYGINTMHVYSHGNVFHADSKEITEHEFNDKFNEILTKLTNII